MLEEGAGVGGGAGEADELVKGAVEVCCMEGGVGARVEGIYVCGVVLVGMDVRRECGIETGDSIASWICKERLEQNILCVTTSLTKPNSPNLPTASCAAFGRARSIVGHPRKLRAQYRFRASWLSQNSPK